MLGAIKPPIPVSVISEFCRSTSFVISFTLGADFGAELVAGGKKDGAFVACGEVGSMLLPALPSSALRRRAARAVSELRHLSLCVCAYRACAFHAAFFISFIIVVWKQNSTPSTTKSSCTMCASHAPQSSPCWDPFSSLEQGTNVEQNANPQRTIWPKNQQSSKVYHSAVSQAFLGGLKI